MLACRSSEHLTLDAPLELCFSLARGRPSRACLCHFPRGKVEPYLTHALARRGIALVSLVGLALASLGSRGISSSIAS